jgi:hypothetical protein
MITVYFDGVKFSEKTFVAEKADIVAIGEREILDVKDRFDNTIAQFDMNCVVGWCSNSYDYTDEEQEESE